jgi:acyl-CoA thioester hydrolase
VDSIGRSPDGEGIIREIRRGAGEVRLSARSRARTPPPTPSHKGRGNTERERAEKTGTGRGPAGTGPVHRFPIRVYYEDTDAAGIVYYANYLKFAERARSEWLRELGDDETAALKASGLVFVVRRCAIDYRQPARLDDLLEVETRVTGAAGATLDLEQIVRRRGSDLVAMTVTLACVNSAGRPARLPAALRTALATVLPD